MKKRAVFDVELSPDTFDELQRKLREADHPHASVETTKGEAILPRGVRLLRGNEPVLAVNE